MTEEGAFACTMSTSQAVLHSAQVSYRVDGFGTIVNQMSGLVLATHPGSPLHLSIYAAKGCSSSILCILPG